MSTPTDTTDTLGDLLETAKPLIMQGLSSLPNGEWIRLGDSDYEACQTSDVGVWLARWKVGRLAVSDCASDLVRVDLGLCWGYATVIVSGVERVVYDDILPGSDVRLQIKYCPREPLAELEAAAEHLAAVYGVIE